MFYTTVHLNYVIIWTNSCDTLSRQSIGADSTYGINNCYAGANDHNPRANIHVIKVIMMLLFYKLIMDEQYPSHISISISIYIHTHTHTHTYTYTHIQYTNSWTGASKYRPIHSDAYHNPISNIYPKPSLLNCRQILYHWATRETPELVTMLPKVTIMT